MSKVRLQDIPSGHDGKGYLTIDGKVVDAFQISKVSAKVESVLENKRFLGERMEQNAARGLKGSGDLEYYHKSSALMTAIRKFKNGGSYPEITLQYWAENNAYGRCEVVLSGIIMADISFGALDDGSDEAIKSSTTFTFDDFDIVSKFEG